MSWAGFLALRRELTDTRFLESTFRRLITPQWSKETAPSYKKSRNSSKNTVPRSWLACVVRLAVGDCCRASSAA